MSHFGRIKEMMRKCHLKYRITKSIIIKNTHCLQNIQNGSMLVLILQFITNSLKLKSVDITQSPGTDQNGS